MTQPTANGQPRMVQLTITLDLSTGQVRVDGPIQDKLLCYGLLERTRDVVRDFDPAKQTGLQIVKTGLAT